MNEEEFDKLFREMSRFFETCHRQINETGIESLNVAAQMFEMLLEMESLLFELQQPGHPFSDDDVRCRQIKILVERCKDLEGNLKEKRNDLHERRGV